MITGDMNARVGDSEVEGVVGKFGASGANKNGRKLMEMCTEKRLSAGNTFFEKRDIHKSTWVSGVGDRKSLLDFIVMQDEERNKLLDVNVLRGVGRGISDHHLIIAKIRSLKRWTGRGVSIEERYEIKVSELRKAKGKVEYEDNLNKRWERVRGKVVGEVVEEERRRFKEIIFEVE